MGQPGRKVIITWKDRVMKRTQGTETSKYLQERKSTETPKVVASEIGSAKKSIWSKKNILGRMTKEGDSPVIESEVWKKE